MPDVRHRCDSRRIAFGVSETENFRFVVVANSVGKSLMLFCDRFGPFGRCPDGGISCGEYLSGKPLLYIEGREGKTLNRFSCYSLLIYIYTFFYFSSGNFIDYFHAFF